MAGPFRTKTATSSSEEVREQARTLGAIFAAMRRLFRCAKTVADAGADPAARGKALESLVAAQDKGKLPLLEELTKQPGPLRRSAIRGLAAYEKADSAKLLLSLYGTFEWDEKREAINTLLARVASARALVAALGCAANWTERSWCFRNFANSPLQRFANRGVVEKTSALLVSSPNKQAEIARYKAFLARTRRKMRCLTRRRCLHKSAKPAIRSLEPAAILARN
jgi:hypothetical protein